MPGWVFVTGGTAVIGLLVVVLLVVSERGGTPTPEIIEKQLWAWDGSVMVYVPAGQFWMGSTNADIDDILAKCNDCERDWFLDEWPQHQVYLDAFWIDRTEVTNEQYKRCVDVGACSSPSRAKSSTRDSYYGNSAFDNYPVIYIGWHQADAYCRWASKRLPTEAEWEKATQGTDGNTYPWGEEIECNRANYHACVGDTTKVGSYPEGASPYGALDMAGNVWEWVADGYDYGYYGKSPGSNPQSLDSSAARVLRGGAWDGAWRNVRAAVRGSLGLSEASGLVGFRCARSGSEP